MFKRTFLIVMDSLGVGEADDAALFDDAGSNTFGHIIEGKHYNLDVFEKLGLTNLVGKEYQNTKAYYMKAKPQNKAKDTLNGHFEMMGLINEVPFKTYPNGFPLELISKIQQVTGREVIGNVVASGTQIMDELGEMQEKTGAIIIYTSADSVLQVTANERIIPLNELYDICQKIRDLTKGEDYKIGRIIARPFTGTPGNYKRTPYRKDYAMEADTTFLDLLDKSHVNVIGIGKIGDIFCNRGINTSIKTTGNLDGIMKLLDFAKSKFYGLCFLNLNDFDSLYGHRRDKDNYLRAIEEFNHYLPIIMNHMTEDDLMIFTADHGNDPTYKGTDHTRENIPVLMYSPRFKKSKRLDDRLTFADIGASILDNYNVKNTLNVGKSILNEIYENEKED